MVTRHVLQATWAWMSEKWKGDAVGADAPDLSVAVQDAPRLRAIRCKLGVLIERPNGNSIVLTPRALEQLAILARQKMGGDTTLEQLMNDTRDRATKQMPPEGYVPPAVTERLDEAQDRARFYFPPLIDMRLSDRLTESTDNRFAETSLRDAEDWLRANGWERDERGWFDPKYDGYCAIFGEEPLRFPSTLAAYEWSQRGRVTVKSETREVVSSG